MRDETVQIETLLGAMNERLEEAGGARLQHALQQMHAVRRFIVNCVSAGRDDELTIAMERAGLGDLAEAWMPLLNKQR